MIVLFKNRTLQYWRFDSTEEAIEFVALELTMNPEDEALILCDGLCHRAAAGWDNDEANVLTTGWQDTPEDLHLELVMAVTISEHMNPKQEWE